MRVYLDYNASAPPSASARQLARELLSAPLRNPSAPSGESRRLQRSLDDARAAVAASVGASPSSVVFTSGGTEAAALALHSALFSDAAPRPHAVCSAVEHAAVLDTLLGWQAQGRVEVSVVPCEGGGHVDPARLAAACTPHTRAVALMRANNETGALMQVHRLRGALPGQCRVVVDAVQAWGKIPLSFPELDADYLVLSAHKVGGLAGAGALLSRTGCPVLPLYGGGGQQRGRRPGTENALGALVMGRVAAELPQWLAKMEGTAALRDTLERACLSLGEVTVNGAAPRLPNTTNLTFHGADAEELLALLDERGVVASTGAACAAAMRRPSHVLAALGLTSQRIAQTVRFSLGPDTTSEEIGYAARVVGKAVEELRGAVR
jgi:cysteine desulfurase